VRRKPPNGPPPEGGYVRRVELRRDEVPSYDAYPFNIPCVRGLDKLELDRHVTIFVGENGSGKSTLVEALAVAIGLNAEGGSKNFNFATRESHSSLAEFLQVVRGSEREQDAFFLRAEGTYNVSSEIERLGRDLFASYGGESLHERSHGEAFLALMVNRFFGEGVYVLDEPESALSPSRQIAMLSLLHDLTHQRSSQIVMATHSPILMAFPGARIYSLSENGIEQVKYEETEHFKVTKAFLSDPAAFVRHLGTPLTS